MVAGPDKGIGRTWSLHCLLRSIVAGPDRGMGRTWLLHGLLRSIVASPDTGRTLLPHDCLLRSNVAGPDKHRQEEWWASWKTLSTEASLNTNVTTKNICMYSQDYFHILDLSSGHLFYIFVDIITLIPPAEVISASISSAPYCSGK